MLIVLRLTRNIKFLFPFKDKVAPRSCSGSDLYRTREACIKWSVGAFLFVFVSSWYYLKVTLFILPHNYWIIYCFSNYAISSMSLLKLVSAIFYQTFNFSPNDSYSEAMNNVFYFRKLFSFSRYSNFCDFFPSCPCFSDSKGQMEVE